MSEQLACRFKYLCRSQKSGGGLNEITKDDIVELIDINGQEKLLYKAFPVNVAFLRGSYKDEYENITVENEVASLGGTSIAQAAKNSGGKVVVQVEKIV